MDYIITFILDVAVTVFGYLLVPIIYCLRKTPKTAKQIKKIVIINGILVWIAFQVLTYLATGETVKSYAVLLWSWVAYIIMKKQLLINNETEQNTDATNVTEQEEQN